MDFKSLLGELRSGSLTSCSAETLANQLALALGNADEEGAERAALAAYYASILPEPVSIPYFEELLVDPATETRERVRGRLWWARLNRTAALSGDDPAPVTELAEAILSREQSSYARLRVFAFLKTWPLRATILPFLGSRPLASLALPDDAQAVYQVKAEAKLAARQAATKGFAVAQSAVRAITAWAADELGLDDAMAAVTVAEPLLADFPWGEIRLIPLAIQAMAESAARPRLRSALRLYGAWLWARFGEPGTADILDALEQALAATEIPHTGAKPSRSLPASWQPLLEALASYRKVDPWCDAALLKLEAMLATSPVLEPPPSYTAIAEEVSRPTRPPHELRLALEEALARQSAEPYRGPACEQSITEMLKPAFARIAPLDGSPLMQQEASTLTSALVSGSPYRVEAAATALRAMSKAGVDISTALQAMAKALLTSPADASGLSPGTDLGPGDLSQKTGCDAAKAFDDVDLPPAETEGGFMNLDNLTMLLAMCLPASTAHRLAKALEAALASGALSDTDRELVDETLRKAAKAGNVAATAWLKERA